MKRVPDELKDVEICGSCVSSVIFVETKDFVNKKLLSLFTTGEVDFSAVKGANWVGRLNTK